MGVLRLLLALSVVIAHAGSPFGLQMTGARVAVESFFMISGFYMALILSDRYAKTPFRLFLSNRLLRIFPPYWFVLLLTISWDFVRLWSKGELSVLQPYLVGPLQPVTTAFLVWTNVFLLGHESTLFLDLDPAGSLAFTGQFGLGNFMLVPQAWTLSLELTFYLLAPLLVKWSSRALATVLLSSLLLRVFIHFTLGVTQDPWASRFFPTELALFVAGMLSFRLYRYWLGPLRPQRERVTPIVVGLVWIITIMFDRIPGGEVLPWAYYCFVFFALPYLFVSSRSNGPDRFVGELSYPVYVSHVFVAFVAGATLFAAIPYELRVMAFTLVFSVALVLLLTNPLDRLRESRVARARLAMGPRTATATRP